MGDVLVVAVKRNRDNARALGGLDGELGLERSGEDANVGRGLGGRRAGAVTGGVVEGGLGEVGDRDKDRLSGSGLDLGSVNGEEDSLKAGEVGEWQEVG